MIETLYTSLPYLFVASVLSVLYYMDKSYAAWYGHHNKVYIYWAYFILLFFFGLRGFVMTDFEFYYPYFDMIDGIESVPSVILVKGWEPGFVYYTYLCKLIIPNYFAWNFMSTLIDLVILSVFIRRYSNNHILFLVVFFVTGALNLEMNYLRNAKAIFIFLLAIKYIHEKKLIKYVLMILLAMSFHMSAIFYLPLYFVLDKQWPKFVLWSIFIVGCVILFCNIDLVSVALKYIPLNSGNENLEHYADLYFGGDRPAYRLSIGSLERICIYIILIKLYYKGKDDFKCRIFFNMYFLIFIIFFYFSANYIIVQRFYLLFIPALWFIYPLFFQILNNRKNYILKYILILLFLFKLSMVGKDPQLRYENLLTGVSSFDDRRLELNRYTGRTEH